MNFIYELSKCREIIPDEYDGSYELVREILNSYKNLEDLSLVDHKDLLLLYSATTIMRKKGYLDQKIKISSLPAEEKMKLSDTIGKIWNKAQNREYIHHKDDDLVEIGMFEALYWTFDRRDPKTGKRLNIVTKPSLVKDFFAMCIDIISMNDDEAIFKRAAEILDERYIGSGFGVGSASQILHCLKPCTFPVLSNKGSAYDKFDIGLENSDKICNYIDNVRKIRNFRDRNFRFKNYRIFDIAPENAVEEKVMSYVSIDTGITFPLNRIIYGPPGTGKTYHTIKYAVEIVENRILDSDENYSEIRRRYDEYALKGRIKFTTFHQSFGYEDFVEGIKPMIVDRYGKETISANSDTHMVYLTKDGVFKKICLLARKNPTLNYVMIIDEINRGNISRIFGELITLIEDTKRGMEAALPYSGEMFSVPPNLYIIGTMNTADRSIAILDTALRRRFDFAEMLPEPDLLTRDCDAVDLREMLTAMNQRIEYYYDREHTIGHAYFMENGVSINSVEKLRKIFKSRIIPLMQEYFFDDYEKIMLILNDEKKHRFIRELDTRYIKDPRRRNLCIGDIDSLEIGDFINIYGGIYG